MDNTIENHSVHLWRIFVPDLLSQVEKWLQVLNPIERARAERFHFAIHRDRFIVSKAVLRFILAFYTNIDAAAIEFREGKQGKPYLSHNPFNLQFNVSHSHDTAVYALATQTEIGVDIEKMEPKFSEGVAERFFSKKEYTELMKLSPNERTKAFYHLWAGKEAIIKTLGGGLYVPLADFSIDLHEISQSIAFSYQQQQYHYYLEHFFAYPDYQAAFATACAVNAIQHWQWTLNGAEKISDLVHKSHRQP
jgi:4'-phosphopantetheinyl transferase